jgi:hypothetical protein
MLPSAAYEALSDCVSRKWCPDDNLLNAPTCEVREATILHLVHSVMAVHYDVKFIGRHALLLVDWLQLQGKPTQPSSWAPLLCQTGAPAHWVVFEWPRHCHPHARATAVGEDLIAAIALWLVQLKKGPTKGHIDSKDLGFLCGHLDNEAERIGKESEGKQTTDDDDDDDDDDSGQWAALRSAHETM